MTLIEFVGIVTHVLREYHRWGLSFTSDPSTAELTASSHQFTEHNNFDGLDKAFVLFRLPPKPSDDGTGTVQRRLTRRVDFIMAPKAKYALAVLGWSGSMMFERDLKYVAQTLILTADAYGAFFELSQTICRKRDASQAHTRSVLTS